MTFLDLFAGIGGFRRGMELAGHKCIGFCEWDKFARASYISMHCITEKQREYLSTLDLKQRQKEILKDEYLNGEWGAVDIRTVTGNSIPRADCWCFGAPCQDFSIAGKRAGLNGDRSSLVREVFRILNEIREEDRPEWLIYENVKGMLSSNRGFDFLSILIEMGERGYDIEWQLLNSKDFGVPQNRERVYTVGHLRSRGGRKIFPISGINTETPELQGQQDRITSNTIHARYTAEDTGCQVGVVQVGQIYGTEKEPNPQAGRIYSADGISPTLDAMGGGGNRMPKILETITMKVLKQDKHGVLFDDGRIIRIRRLTPKECFRLQGWTDDYFEKAAFVNSYRQLYKQAGNGVTVNVVQAIGELIDK